MISFVLKRLFSGLLVLVAVVVLVSAIIYSAPVDPTSLSFGQQSDAETISRKRSELGLDKSLIYQIRAYLRDLSPVSRYSDLAYLERNQVHHIKILGSEHWVLKSPYFRESFQNGRKVSAILLTAIPKTAILALSAFCIAALLGILLGILSALNKNRPIDKLILLVSALGYSIPSYVSAILFALVFGFWLGPWTGLNVQGSLVEINDLGDDVIVWKNLILPALALGVRPIAVITQLTRASFLDVLDEAFIRTATAKGLSYPQVVLKHAFRNSMNPITSSLSGWLASLFAGAFFVENVFNYKGLGTVTVKGLLFYDIPVVLAAVIVIAFVFVIINIMVDLLYVLIDPRIRIN